MNIYRVTQPGNAYETFDAMIVAAPDEATARSIHPRYDAAAADSSEWAAPEKLTVELIGTALEGTTAGVILASFCAG